MKENSTACLLPEKFLKNLNCLGLFLLILIAGNARAQVSSYNFSQFQGNYTPLVNPTVIITATQATGNLAADDTILTLPSGTIPFTFKFDNIGYTGFKISSNGFLTFGTTSPSTTNTNPLSSANAYAGCISAFPRQLIGIFVSAGNAGNGEISYQTQGTSPSREFVVQFKNFRATTQTSNPPPVGFQIRLQEGSNRIRIVYNVTSGFTNTAMQVGLRGPNSTFPANINNRSVVSGTNTWLTSTAGTSASSTCTVNGTFIPPAGTTYEWTICPVTEQHAYRYSTQTSSTIYWKGYGNSYEIEWGAAGFTPGAGTVVNTPDTQLVINGLTAGTTYNYYIRNNCTASGTGYSARTGPIVFKTGVNGEDCATATNLSIAANYASTSPVTVNTGVSSNAPASTCTDSSGKVGGNDVWMKFTAPAGNQKLVFRTFAGTINDWIMEIWNGCPGSPGSFVIVCNDDSGTAANGFTNSMPYLELCQNQYNAGNTYYLRMWTSNSQLSGNMTLRAHQDSQCPIPPAYDECEDAIAIPVSAPLSCPGNAVTLTTLFATASTAVNPVMGCDNGTKNDVWLKFNTGNYGTLRVYITPLSATDLKAGVVFDCMQPDVIACWNPANGSYLLSGLNPAADYRIRVWSAAGGSGTFSVCIEDVCDDASATISGNTSICPGGSAQLKVDLGGTPPWTFSYSNGSTTQSITTSTTPYFINVSPVDTGIYNYYLTAFSTKICPGSFSGIASVAVLAAPVVTLAPLPTLCSNVNYTFTEGSPTGGAYSGPGVTGKVFNASVAGPGVHTITYTYGTGSGCVKTATRTITVNAAPVISYFSPTTAPIGSSVSVYGTNFSASTVVKFNGTTVTTKTVISSTEMSVIVPAGATTGTISTQNTNGCTVVSTANFAVGTTPTITVLNLKLFLQGMYIGSGRMNAAIDPGLYPNNADSITVELHPVSNVYQASQIRRGVLSTTGHFSCTYPNTVGNSWYYVVVKHRSSVETWSKNPIYFPYGGSVTYDFTVPAP